LLLSAILAKNLLVPSPQSEQDWFVLLRLAVDEDSAEMLPYYSVCLSKWLAVRHLPRSR
jgi:hypothetical protein